MLTPGHSIGPLQTALHKVESNEMGVRRTEVSLKLGRAVERDYLFLASSFKNFASPPNDSA
jgi:hypothetical protein